MVRALQAAKQKKNTTREGIKERLALIILKPVLLMYSNEITFEEYERVHNYIESVSVSA